MKNSVLKDKSKAFAIRIVKLYKYLQGEKKEFVMSKQILRSGTSIGANIHEAYFGQSKKDFTSEMQIALKEASETDYWLNILSDTEFLDKSESESIKNDCIELVKMLNSTVKTAKGQIITNSE